METSWMKKLRHVIATSTWLQRPSFVVGGSILVVVLAEYLMEVRFFVSSTIFYLTYWLILTATFSILATAELHRFHREDDRLFVSLFLAGALIGFFSALFKVLAFQELWTAFNILAEPMRTALLALVIGWLFV